MQPSTHVLGHGLGGARLQRCTQRSLKNVALATEVKHERLLGTNSRSLHSVAAATSVGMTT